VGCSSQLVTWLIDVPMAIGRCMTDLLVINLRKQSATTQGIATGCVPFKQASHHCLA
jgi:hypothetical protein